MLKSELRHLQHQVNEAQKFCETCVRRNSKITKEVLIQTDNLQDDGESRYYDFGGSGIIRVCIFLKCVSYEYYVSCLEVL